VACICALISITILSLCGPAFAERRVALAIGIDRYGNLPQGRNFKKAIVLDAKHSEASELLLTQAPDARYTEEAAVAECDRLAASPYDDDRTSTGIEFYQIDAARAIPACRQAVAINPNVARLMFQLGRALGMNGDYSEAQGWYERAAAKANALAMINLGNLYAEGLGVSRDYAKAREWFEKAAANDNAIAMTNLGDLYAEGYGVAQDYTKAREWYEQGAARGDAIAMNRLGSLYGDRPGERAAPRGDTPVPARCW
jgi:TPR repeat protein